MGASGRQLEELAAPARQGRSQAAATSTLKLQSAGNQADLMAGKTTATPVFDKPEHAIDPTTKYYWERFGESELLRKEYFDITLAAAPGEYLNLKAAMEESGPPKNESEVGRFGNQFKILVRLMALGLMASHRAGIEGRQAEVLAAIGGSGTGGAKARSESVAMILQAADHIRELGEIKSALIDSRAQLDRISSRAIKESRMSDEEIESYLIEIRESISPFQDDQGRERFNYSVQRLASQEGVRDQRLRATTPAALWSLARELAAWRQGQINVIAGLLYQLHETFPFFAKVSAEDVLQSTSEQEVVAHTKKGYGELIGAIDAAIVAIGSGDIDAFDLPEAVKLTIEDLSPALQGAARRAIAHHRTVQFWKTMGLSGVQLAIAFIPVIGPFIAAGIGAVQFGADLESMLDKRALVGASNQPGRGILGVEGPSSGEWALMIATAALTIADLHAGVSIARSRSMPRPMHELDYDVGAPPGRVKQERPEPASGISRDETGTLSEQDRRILELNQQFPDGFLSDPGKAPMSPRGEGLATRPGVPAETPPAWMLKDIEKGNPPPTTPSLRAEIPGPPTASSSGVRKPKASQGPEIQASRRTPAEEQAFNRDIEQYKQEKNIKEFERTNPPEPNAEYQELMAAAEPFEDLSAGPPRNALDRSSRSGTRRDQAFKKVTADVLRKQGLEGKLFTSSDWKDVAEALDLDVEKVFQTDVLWRKSGGPDVLFVDKGKHVVKSVDLATSPNAGHFQQKAAQMRKLGEILNNGKPKSERWQVSHVGDIHLKGKNATSETMLADKKFRDLCEEFGWHPE